MGAHFVNLLCGCSHVLGTCRSKRHFALIMPPYDAIVDAATLLLLVHDRAISRSIAVARGTSETGVVSLVAHAASFFTLHHRHLLLYYYTPSSTPPPLNSIIHGTPTSISSYRPHPCPGVDRVVSSPLGHKGTITVQLLS